MILEIYHRFYSACSAVPIVLSATWPDWIRLFTTGWIKQLPSVWVALAKPELR